jgi:hypothetical protein
MPTYCGNNLNNPKLVAGTHVVGTNYQCLRKGIGVGSHLPYDSSYAGPYAPVDPRRFYCGNAAIIPAGYFAAGSPSKCLQVGIGVGKVMRAGLGPPAFMYFIRYVLPYLLFCLLTGMGFTFVYFYQLKFFVKEGHNKKVVIDWDKFIPYFVSYMLVISVLIWFIWKKIILRRV